MNPSTHAPSTSELLTIIEQLQDKLSNTQQELEISNSKSEYDSTLRTKIKNVLLENIANEKIIRSMETQIEQLSTENTRLKTEKRPLKTSNQVLEFTKQIDYLQCALKDSVLNERRIMKRYKECLLKFNQLEKHIKDINVQDTYDPSNTLVPALPVNEQSLIASLKTFALKHEDIITQLDAATKSSAELIIEAQSEIIQPSQSSSIKQPEELNLSFYTDANTSFDSDQTLSTDKLIPKIKDLLQKINETDIMFINRNLKQTIEVTFITDCSNALLTTLEEEILLLSEFGEIGLLFGGILNDLIRLRMDMNKFYSMYYEKMENRSRSESGSIKSESVYEEHVRVKWSVGRVIEKQVTKLWSLF